MKAAPGVASARQDMTDVQIADSYVGGPPKRVDGRIRLSRYSKEWPGLFAREAGRIRRALGPRALTVEHVGSTAVPGLQAKPIIDVLLVVENSADEAAYVPSLEAAGYVLRIRERNWHEHRVFKGPDTDVNMHVFSRGDGEADRMLLFRDWLRGNKPDRELYQRTKLRLASKRWKYVQNYADAKSRVVESIMRRAAGSKKPRASKRAP